MNLNSNCNENEKIISGTEIQVEKDSKDRLFKIVVVAIVGVVILYLVYHLFSYIFNGYNTAVKKEFSEYESGIILSEIGVDLQENNYISNAKYTAGKDPVLMIWIDGIDDGVDFIENYTGFDPLDYRNVSIGVSQTQSAAARHYSVIKSGDEELTECYLYKLDNSEKWTAYLIENDVTNSNIKEIFIEEDES